MSKMWYCTCTYLISCLKGFLQQFQVAEATQPCQYTRGAKNYKILSCNSPAKFVSLWFFPLPPHCDKYCVKRSWPLQAEQLGVSAKMAVTPVSTTAVIQGCGRAAGLGSPVTVHVRRSHSHFSLRASSNCWTVGRRWAVPGEKHKLCA